MMKKLLALLLTFATVNLMAQVNLTIRVDMSAEVVSPDGVFVQGDWNGWAGDAMTDTGGGIYEAVVPVNPSDASVSQTYQYGFFNGLITPGNPNREIVPTTCDRVNAYAPPTGVNRLVTVNDQDVYLPAIPFAGCGADVQLDFIVDMTYADATNGVFVVGGADFGCPGFVENVVLTQIPTTNLYQGTVTVNEGYTGYFALANGTAGSCSFSDKEQLAGCNTSCVSGQYSDRYIAVGAGGASYNTCYGECSTSLGSCTDPNTVQTYPVIFQVDMTNETVGTGVSMAGDSGIEGSGPGWTNNISLANVGGTIWEVTLNLPEGSYDYKFVNGPAGSWAGGGENPPANCTSSTNRQLTVCGAAPAAPLLDCFNSCGATCPVVYDAVLQVDMGNETVDPTGVFLVTNWNNWNPLAMTNIGGTIWEYTIPNIGDGLTYEYKFANGIFQESIANDVGCVTQPWNNRSFTVSGGVYNPGPLCFNSCSATCPTIPVTYSVDMTLEVINGAFDPNTQKVFVAGGSYWHWCGLALEDGDGDFVYEGTRFYNAGEIVEYKFYAGQPGFIGDWLCDNTSLFEPEAELIAGGCGPGAFNNRVLNVPTGVTSLDLPTVCYGTCAACIIPPVPTVSEWGLMTLAILLLIMGTLGITYLVPQSRLSTGQTMSMSGFFSNPPFNKAIFVKCLLATIGLALVAGGLSFLVFGEITLVDIIGTTIVAPLFAYLTHLWVKK